MYFWSKWLEPSPIVGNQHEPSLLCCSAKVGWSFPPPPLTYLILIRLYISGFWLWLKAEIPNTTREDWGFFTFFPWPFQKLEVLKCISVSPIIQFSVPAPKIGVWSSFLWKLRLRHPDTACTLLPLQPAQPPWRWQVTEVWQGCPVQTTGCLISPDVPCLPSAVQTAFGLICCTVVVVVDCCSEHGEAL